MYIETTIPSYLTAKPSSDPRWEADRLRTVAWWDASRERFEMVTSVYTLEECSRGDAASAAARLAALDSVPLLEVTPAVLHLADELRRTLALPPRARTDADHLAAASVHGAEYLLTWNCTHLANAALRGRIDATCLAAGHRPPNVCTPTQLMEEVK